MSSYIWKKRVFCTKSAIFFFQKLSPFEKNARAPIQLTIFVVEQTEYQTIPESAQNKNKSSLVSTYSWLC